MAASMRRGRHLPGTTGYGVRVRVRVNPTRSGCVNKEGYAPAGHNGVRGSPLRG